MNSVVLVGNLCRDGELRYSQGESATAIYRNTVAVQRKFKNKETGSYESDFVSILAYGNNAEFINKYFNKGSKIGILGHIQTGSYTNKDGVKVYTTDVIVDSTEFVSGKNDNASNGGAATDASTVTATKNTDEEELPFN